jgi:hypothetical protein
LVVDDSEPKYGHSPGKTAMLNLRSPVFVGGLPARQESNVRSKLKDIGGSFDGCIQKVKVNSDHVVSMRSFETKELVSACETSDLHESGAYFTGKSLPPFPVTSSLLTFFLLQIQI